VALGVAITALFVVVGHAGRVTLPEAVGVGGHAGRVTLPEAVGVVGHAGRVTLPEAVGVGSRVPRDRADSAVRLVWLEEIDRSTMTCGVGVPKEGHSFDGAVLQLGGKTYEHGLGVHATSLLVVPVNGNALAFEAEVGIDDERGKTTPASVEFRVWVDGRIAATSGVLRRGRRRRHLKVDLTGAQRVALEVSDAGDGNDCDHADWADAFFTFKDGTGPGDSHKSTPQLGILTPRTRPSAVLPGTDDLTLRPKINGPMVFGVRPHSPILYRIPVSGTRPMDIRVTKLRGDGFPPGIFFDPANSTLTGRVERAGEYPLVITAKNAHGEAQRTLRLVVGDAIALTPPMGWNSWNVFAGKVTSEKVLAQADALLASGLADHGWNYINVDDYWQNRPGETEDRTLMGAPRAADGTINSNARFPSMQALAEAIHAKGLRIGIYSSPGPTTCGGCEGSWRHERQDARTFADWGFDLLKYDWCSYERVAVGAGLDRARLPYLVMGRALREQSRDIVFSLCQYGKDQVSAWGKTVYGSSWRTTNDVFDQWRDVYDAIDHQSGLWQWSAPGAFNDPDMLCLGKMTWNQFQGSRLTPNEQYTQMSMWCLMAAPLMIGCDLTQLDDFTLNLLTNDEVLAIDQDPLGKAAARVARCGLGEIWARPLFDGSVAMGLLNADLAPMEIQVDLASLGLEGTWHVRDLWRQRDESDAKGAYAATVPGHATHLIKLSPSTDGHFRHDNPDIRETALEMVLVGRPR